MYYDVAPPREELEYILRTARGYLARFLAAMPVPWEPYSGPPPPAPTASCSSPRSLSRTFSGSSGNALSNSHAHAAGTTLPQHTPQLRNRLSDQFLANDRNENKSVQNDNDSLAFSKTQLRINEMLRVLNLNDDGSAAPLTWGQRLQYGTHARYLKSKLRNAKAKAESIEEQFSRLNEGEEDLKDVMLIQHFILEALSPLQRFVVRKKFFDFEMQEPESIGKMTWIAGWMLEWVTMIFLCYYVLAWAALVGDVMFRAWLIQFSFILVEDFFITQLIRAILVHGLAISYCKPQLLQIYHLLKKIAVRKILQQDDMHEDIRVVQHFSGACRASRRESMHGLPAAQLLMQIDDNDMKLCNDVRRLKFTWVQVMLISIPLFFGMAGDQGQEFAFDMVINITWGGILILNAIVFTVISSWYLFGFYVLVFAFIVYRAIKFYQKRNKKRKAKRQSRGELARFMSMRNKRTKFNLVSQLKTRHRSNVLELSKKELQWRNMNLCLRQPVSTTSIIPTSIGTESGSVSASVSAPLSAHAVYIPESIRNLSTLAPLLTAHFPPPIEADTTQRPQSWLRPTSIRSRHRSRRVAAFWQARKVAAREVQLHSTHYAQCRAHFLRISGGTESLSEHGDILALATWVRQIKITPNMSNIIPVDSSYEVNEIAKALMQLMLYSEERLYLSVTGKIIW